MEVSVGEVQKASAKHICTKVEEPVFLDSPGSGKIHISGPHLRAQAEKGT